MNNLYELEEEKLGSYLKSRSCVRLKQKNIISKFSFIIRITIDIQWTVCSYCMVNDYLNQIDYIKIDK